MRTLVFAGAVGLAVLGVQLSDVSISNTGFVSSAHAQAVPKTLELSGTETAFKDKKNAWTVGVAGGLLSGTYMTFADELAQVLDDGDNLRILPIVTYGAASNLDDLLYLRGIDVAVTQSDVFEYFRTQRKTPNLDQRINYIIRLPVSELHILARKEIRSLEDLRGKKVSFGPQGAGSSLTGSIVFQRLGIKVEQLFLDNPTATQKLASGEISALMRQIGKPIDVFAKIPKDSPYHFLPIPFSKTSEKPRIALRGVRSSWLILARNCDLARLAASAAAFASCTARSARTFSVMSRAVPRYPRNRPASSKNGLPLTEITRSGPAPVSGL